MMAGDVSPPLRRRWLPRWPGLTKERHAGRVYGLEFSQVLLEMVLAQLHSFFQDFLFPFCYRLHVQTREKEKVQVL